MSGCETQELTATVTLSFEACKEHGHGRMTSAMMESGGAPVMAIVDGILGMVEESLAQFAADYPSLTSLNGWDTLPERAQRHLAKLLARDVMLSKVAERDYNVAGAGALLTLPMLD